MNQRIGNAIANKRKELGLTQQKLAEQLDVSFQAVSKWEKGTTTPDISLLPRLANILNMSVDALVGRVHAPITEYEKKYGEQAYYWGVAPNRLCYEIMKLKPPIKPYRVLDIGCGEGKDAVFFAKNGYIVSAFDAAETGLEKARELARQSRVEIDFFKADVNEYQLSAQYDIIFSSGVFHYISLNRRQNFIDQLKDHTAQGGINAVNVFVQKPFIAPAPDWEEAEKRVEPWYSGDLFRCYHDWLFHKQEEVIFNCSSGGAPHQHCMDILIAEKKR